MLIERFKMANTALVQAKIDPELKKEAEKRFSRFGLDSATAIRMFFAKVVQTNRMPFTVGFDSFTETAVPPFAGLMANRKPDITSLRCFLGENGIEVELKLV